MNFESGLWQAMHIWSKTFFPSTAKGLSISGSSSRDVIGPTPLFSKSTRCEAGTLLSFAGASVDSEEDEVELADRKSTRLNSSHVAISYAVFCLKKKNSVSQVVGMLMVC